MWYRRHCILLRSTAPILTTTQLQYQDKHHRQWRHRWPSCDGVASIARVCSQSRARSHTYYYIFYHCWSNLTDCLPFKPHQFGEAARYSATCYWRYIVRCWYSCRSWIMVKAATQRWSFLDTWIRPIQTRPSSATRWWSTDLCPVNCRRYCLPSAIVRWW